MLPVCTACIIKCTYTTSPDIVDPRLSRSRPRLSRLFHNMRLTPRHLDPILPPTLIITAGIATLLCYIIFYIKNHCAIVWPGFIISSLIIPMWTVMGSDLSVTNSLPTC